MGTSKPYGLRVNGNHIKIHSLKHPKDVSKFYSSVYTAAIIRGYSDIILDFSTTEPIYPNACVPVVAAIDYYRAHGVKVEATEPCHFVEKSCILSPREANAETLELTADPVSKLWKFGDSEGVHTLTSMYVESISERLVCEKGVLEGFEWCINEVMDNVLQHSEAEYGYVMVQVHSGHQNVAVCISDAGIGIFNSFAHSKYKPRTHTDAITLAIKEGVTRDSSIGQGNGLWGLNQIVTGSNGRLALTSGGGSLFHREGKIRTFSELPFLSKDNLGTTVDFQLSTGHEINISESLSYDHVSLRVESYVRDGGDYEFYIKDESHGTGTRQAAIMVRNKIDNLLQEVHGKIILNFKDVAVISSSYADELVGKLIVRFGFFNFQKLVGLDNMNDTVQGILHRSIAQRMGESISSSQKRQPPAIKPPKAQKLTNRRLRLFESRSRFGDLIREQRDLIRFLAVECGGQAGKALFFGYFLLGQQKKVTPPVTEGNPASHEVRLPEGQRDAKRLKQGRAIKKTWRSASDGSLPLFLPPSSP